MDTHTGSTKEIMANSQLEVTNPAFNKMVINKIIRRQKSRLILSHIFFYLLIVSIAAGIIVTQSRRISALGDIIMNGIVQLGTWFLSNEFIILPFLILLAIKGIIDITLNRHVNN